MSQLSPGAVTASPASDPHSDFPVSGSAGADATGRYLTIVNVSCCGLECPAELAALMRSV